MFQVNFNKFLHPYAQYAEREMNKSVKKGTRHLQGDRAYFRGPQSGLQEILQNRDHYRGVVTLSARCARAHPVFGSDKGKDLCGHTQFLLRNVPEKDLVKPTNKL